MNPAPSYIGYIFYVVEGTIIMDTITNFAFIRKEGAG